jgi:hypothetical protein
LKALTILVRAFFIRTSFNLPELAARQFGFLCQPKLGTLKFSLNILGSKVLLILLALQMALVAESDGQSLQEKLAEIEIRPFGRMIRQCCNFGYGAPVYWMPVNMGYITSVDLLGNHVFYGDDQEGNGIIYSNCGGFLDLGHIRDNADLVAFFAWHINQNLGKDTSIVTVREGGKRRINLHLKDQELSENDILLIAQRMSYEMGVWHEIRTYFGVATYWPVHEKQSAFSPEDNYSNLLGTIVGYKALKADGHYLKNVESEIDSIMNSYGAVSTSEETRKAMDDVRGLWWRKVSLPSNRFLLAKYFDTYGILEPWVIPSHTKFFEKEAPLESLQIPKTTTSGISLTDFFTLDIKPVNSIPVKKVVNRKRNTGISETDFPAYVKWIEQHEIERDERKNRKSKRQASQDPVVTTP